MNRSTVLRVTVAACLLVATAASGTSAADAAPTRTESPVNSSGPADGVTETVVSVHLPLPAFVGAHPAACDWLSYLRFRDSAPGYQHLDVLTAAQTQNDGRPEIISTNLAAFVREFDSRRARP